jgi:hypothetical protein
MDKDRHLIDCLSYILLDSPRFIDPFAKRPKFNPIYPDLAEASRFADQELVGCDCQRRTQLL